MCEGLSGCSGSITGSPSQKRRWSVVDQVGNSQSCKQQVMKMGTMPSSGKVKEGDFHSVGLLDLQEQTTPCPQCQLHPWVLSLFHLAPQGHSFCDVITSIHLLPKCACSLTRELAFSPHRGPHPQFWTTSPMSPVSLRKVWWLPRVDKTPF